MKFRIIKQSHPKDDRYPYIVQKKIFGLHWWGIEMHDTQHSAESSVRDRILKRGEYAKKGFTVIKELSSEDLVVEKLRGEK